jgi:hypothetical protein
LWGKQDEKSLTDRPESVGYGEEPMTGKRGNDENGNENILFYSGSFIKDDASMMASNITDMY